MPDLDNSLQDLAHLIGLLNSDGGINWAWFGNPEAYLLGTTDPSLMATAGLAAGSNRDYIGQLLRELTGTAPNTLGTDTTLVAPFAWVPVSTNGAPVRVGIGWSKGTPDVELALGADFQPGGGVDLALLAKLIGIKQGTVTPLFKDALLSGKLPPPDFLSAISIEGDTTPLQLTVTVDDLNSGEFKQTFSPASTAFAWDAVRLALFIVKAWIQKNAATPTFGGFGTQLLALLGDPATTQYPVFPLLDATTAGTGPNFNGWWNNFLPAGGTAASAQALLSKLAAIITGAPNSKLLAAAGSAAAPAGSLFFQLLTGTSPSQPLSTYTPGQMGAGAWIGLLNTGAGAFTLSLDVQTATNGSFARIPLVNMAGGAISLPTPTSPDVTYLASNLAALNAVLPFKITGSGSSLQIPLFSATLNAEPLSGNYSFNISITSGAKVSFGVALAGLPAIPFPLDTSLANAQTLLADLVDWIVKFLPSSLPSQASGVITAAGSFTSAELRNPGGTPPIGNLLTGIALALAPAGTSINVVNSGAFNLSVGLGPDPAKKDSYFHVMPNLSYGPITVDQIPDFPIGIGKLSGSIDLGIDSASPFNGFSLGFDDLRIGDDKGGATGLLASLIPNLKDAPGFSLTLAWTAASGIKVTGGGQIPLQVTLGPLNLSQLQVDASASGLNIGISLSFALSVITVNAYELGLNFDFKTGIPTPSLQGLGLSFDAAGITLSGMFLNNKGDYVGGAAVSIEDMFSLSALGGYTQLAGGQASMFIFASLTAPLGGPPFFFVTGIAGGFGYNRTLPPPTLMGNHPFFKIMSGEIQVSTNPKDGLAALDDPNTGFAPKAGDYWIAAGVQFISFGFIHGKVILAVGLGKDFSIDILGVASFGIDPVAYFEIDILVTVDKEKFLLVAGMSPNSYLIHPDIFNMSGDFALGAWHSGPHQGDFLISIGGFHPYFKTPSYYPVVNRITVNATVFGFVHLTIQCFFACTPQALMAGASVSLSAEFAGIGAGLDVYIDVFIQWDPFFILAEMGVDLWFDFLGRHDIGVDLQIHTPPFGGVAHISLFIISFSVSFGDNDGGHPTLAVDDFFTKHLAVPATPTGAANDANVAIFNTAANGGLVRVVFTAGTVAKPTADASKLQEGTDPNDPVQVSPEFSFLVKTKLPLYTSSAQDNLSGTQQGELAMTSDAQLALCGVGDLTTTLTVKLTNATEKNPIWLPNSAPVNEEEPQLVASYGYYPLAYFGDAPLVAQADQQSARDAIANIDTSTPAIQLCDGAYFNLNAVPIPLDSPIMQGPVEELSEGTQNYPLPLGGPQSTYLPKAALSFLASAAAQAAVVKNVAQIRPGVTASLKERRVATAPAAAKLVSTGAGFNRRVKASAAIVTAVAKPPAGVVTMAPPASPARRAELAGVGLNLRPARTVAAAPKPLVRSLAGVILPVEAVRMVLTAPTTAPVAVTTVATAPTMPQVTVTSGQAVHVGISGAGVPGGTLTFAGQQTVRAIFSTAFGEPVADSYITGNQKLTLPLRSRNLLLIGEGTLTGAPASLGSVGTEASTSVYAVDTGQFASYGCVLRPRSSIAAKIAPGQTLLGADLLGAAAGWSVLFPAAGKSACLVITIKPAVANPSAAATQVRWRASNATLGAAAAVVSPDRAAFVMDAQAAQAWTLDADVGADWRIASMVMADMAAADALAILRGSANWSFVDDRFVEPASPMNSTVTLEIANA